MAPKGTVVVKFVGDTSGLEGALGKARGAIGGFGSGLGKIAAIAGGALAVDKLKAFGMASLDAFGESQKVAGQTEAALKSTGGAAGVTAGHVGDLANQLKKLSGMSDESIQSGQNLLLTFTGIKNQAGAGNDIFDQTSKVMVDMAARMGGDASRSAIQLGKALNDPVKGLTALTRVGVSFTDQQKEQIKQLVASGDTLGAQKIILAELNKEFGGSAKAMGEAMTPIDRLKLKFDDFQEVVGGKVNAGLQKLGDLAGPIASKAMTLGSAFVSAFSGEGVTSDGLVGKFEQAGVAVRGFVDNLGPVFARVKEILGPEIAQLGELIAPLGEMFSSAFEAVRAVVDAGIAIVQELWDRFGSLLVERLQVAWDAIVQILQGAIQVITGIFDLIKAIVTGKWGEAWSALGEIFTGLWNVFVGLFRAAINSISLIIGAAMAGISAAWSAIWHGLATLFSDLWGQVTGAISTGIDGVVGFFTDLPGRVLGAVGDIVGKMRQLGEDIIDAIVKGIKAAPSALVKAIESLIPGGGIVGGAIKKVGGLFGFDTGGVVPGPTGAPVLALVHGGETILPTHRSGFAVGGPAVTTSSSPVYLDGRQVTEVVHRHLLDYKQRNGTTGL